MGSNGVVGRAWWAYEPNCESGRSRWVGGSRVPAIEVHNCPLPGSDQEAMKQSNQLLFVVGIVKRDSRKLADQIVAVDQVGHGACILL